MLVETQWIRAGAPFPHCGAAHGASGGPRATPEGGTGDFYNKKSDMLQVALWFVRVRAGPSFNLHWIVHKIVGLDAT